MRILKKLLRRLYHLIAFLSLFLLFSPNVFAEDITVGYSNMYTSYANYASGITCNNENCVVPNVRYYFNQSFTTKWVTSTSYSCQNGASITGQMSTLGSGEWVFNNDWLSNKIQQVFIDTNSTRYACSFSLIGSNQYGNIKFNCYLPKLSSNFAIGFILNKSSENNVYGTASNVIARRIFTVSCDNTASAITQNNNYNTDRIINNNNTNSAQERQKIQENTDAVNGLKQEQSETNDTLQDSSVTDPSNSINGLKNNIHTDNVISSLILLPVKFLQSIVNSLNGTCNPFALGSLYNHTLSMPCIDIESYVGSGIWTFIDMVFSAMFILVIRKKFIQIYQNITNLRNGVNEVD